MKPSWLSRFKSFIKSLIVLLPGGYDYLLGKLGDDKGIRYRGKFGNYEQAKFESKLGIKYDILNSTKEQKADDGSEPLDTWFLHSDYPVVYWMRKLLEQNSTVVELGGSVGHFFYSTKRFLDGTEIDKWVISELPEAVRIGRKIAAQREQGRLFFEDSEKLNELPIADLFLTAGTIQYMEADLADMLSSLAELPKAIVVNNLPVSTTITYWTLQNLGKCEVPYKIYNRETFINSLLSMGYQLEDSWSIERRVEIPKHPECHVATYDGFCFVKSA